MWRRLCIAGVLLIAVGVFSALHENITVPLAKSFKEFPQVVGQWHQVKDVTFTASVISVLQATDYVFRDYADEKGELVNLYVGFHDGGPGSGPIHSPRHCLPGAGWFLESQEKVSVPMVEGQVQIVRAVYSKDSQTNVFYYWFSVKDAIIIDEYSLKFRELVNSFTQRRKDSTFVRISMSTDGKMDDKAVFLHFFKDFYPLIRDFLPS